MGGSVSTEWTHHVPPLPLLTVLEMFPQSGSSLIHPVAERTNLLVPRCIWSPERRDGLNRAWKLSCIYHIYCFQAWGLKPVLVAVTKPVLLIYKYSQSKLYHLKENIDNNSLVEIIDFIFQFDRFFTLCVVTQVECWNRKKESYDTFSCVSVVSATEWNVFSQIWENLTLNIRILYCSLIFIDRNKNIFIMSHIHIST